MNTAANEAADIITGTYGHGARALTITYRRLLHTWTVTVYMGTLRIDELCDTYDHAHAAWHEARRIAKAAHNGHDIARILNEKPAHLALAEAKQLIDGITATLAEKRAELDTATAEAKAAAAQTQASIAQTGGWYALRRDAIARNQPRPTMAGAHLAPPTPVQIAAARQHRDGVIYPDANITRPTLKALARKGYGTVRYAGTRKQIVALDLNSRGFALAGQPSKERVA